MHRGRSGRRIEDKRIAMAALQVSPPLVVKVRMGADVRRMPISNADLTYDDLVLMLQRVFRSCLQPGDDLLLKYQDEGKANTAQEAKGDRGDTANREQSSFCLHSVAGGALFADDEPTKRDCISKKERRERDASGGQTLREGRCAFFFTRRIVRTSARAL